jgi:hypothetical protein
MMTFMLELILLPAGWSAAPRRIECAEDIFSG